MIPVDSGGFRLIPVDCGFQADRSTQKKLTFVRSAYIQMRSPGSSLIALDITAVDTDLFFFLYSTGTIFFSYVCHEP